jgi:hypothetical protein
MNHADIDNEQHPVPVARKHRADAKNLLKRKILEMYDGSRRKQLNHATNESSLSSPSSLVVTENQTSPRNIQTMDPQLEGTPSQRKSEVTLSPKSRRTSTTGGTRSKLLRTTPPDENGTAEQNPIRQTIPFRVSTADGDNPSRGSKKFLTKSSSLKKTRAKENNQLETSPNVVESGNVTTQRIMLDKATHTSLSTLETVLLENDEDDSRRTLRSHRDIEHEDRNNNWLDGGCSFTFHMQLPLDQEAPDAPSIGPSIPNDDIMENGTSMHSITSSIVEPALSLAPSGEILESKVTKRRSKTESTRSSPRSRRKSKKETMLDSTPSFLQNEEDVNEDDDIFSTFTGVVEVEAETGAIIWDTIIDHTCQKPSSTKNTLAPAREQDTGPSIPTISKDSALADDLPWTIQHIHPSISRQRSLTLSPYTSLRRRFSPLNKPRRTSTSGLDTGQVSLLLRISANDSDVGGGVTETTVTRSTKDGVNAKSGDSMLSRAGSPKFSMKKCASARFSSEVERPAISTTRARKGTSASPRTTRKSAATTTSSIADTAERNHSGRRISSASPRSMTKPITATRDVDHTGLHSVSSRGSGSLKRSGDSVDSPNLHDGSASSYVLQNRGDDVVPGRDQSTCEKNHPVLTRRVSDGEVQCIPPWRIHSFDRLSEHRRMMNGKEPSNSSRSKSKGRTNTKLEGSQHESKSIPLGRASSSPTIEGSDVTGCQDYTKPSKRCVQRNDTPVSSSATSMSERKSRSKSPSPRSSISGSLLPMAKLERTCRSQSPRKSKRQPKSHRNPEKLSKWQIQHQPRHHGTPVFTPYTRRLDDDDDSENEYRTNSPRTRKSKRPRGSPTKLNLERQRESVLEPFEKLSIHDDSRLPSIPLETTRHNFGPLMCNMSLGAAITELERPI